MQIWAEASGIHLGGFAPLRIHSNPCDLPPQMVICSNPSLVRCSTQVSCIHRTWLPGDVPHHALRRCFCSGRSYGGIRLGLVLRGESWLKGRKGGDWVGRLVAVSGSQVICLAVPDGTRTGPTRKNSCHDKGVKVAVGGTCGTLAETRPTRVLIISHNCGRVRCNLKRRK